MDLVNVIVFGVNNICKIIIFFLEKCYQTDYTGEPSQSEVWVKASFHHSWYLVERELDMEGKRSLFVSVPKGKISLQQEGVPGLIWTLEIFVVSMIKFITLYVNQKLTNITPSCKIFIINVHMANCAGVDYIIGIFRDTH